MARNELRPAIKLRSTAGTGFTCSASDDSLQSRGGAKRSVTRKNRRNDPDRLELRKNARVAGRHVTFREER